ncbi:MAG: hypothetical protein V4714_06925 [Bacteroidota bacterium]
MEDIEETQMLAERWEGDRIKWIKWMLLGFMLWDGARISEKYLFPGQYEFVLAPMIAIGTIIWMVGMLKLSQLSKLLKKNKQLNIILNDEMIVLHRLKAFTTGFYALVATQVLIQFISYSHPFSSILAADISIFVGVVSAGVAFIVYHR